METVRKVLSGLCVQLVPLSLTKRVASLSRAPSPVFRSKPDPRLDFGICGLLKDGYGMAKALRGGVESAVSWTQITRRMQSMAEGSF